jgi:hypothetical protein
VKDWATLALVAVGVGGVVYLATRPAPAATPPQVGPAPSPAPGGPLPPSLAQGLQDLLARAAANPSQVDPDQMDQFAQELQAAGYPDQAAQVHQAAAAVRLRKALPVPGPPAAAGYGRW